jgi:hypothetical protein
MRRSASSESTRPNMAASTIVLDPLKHRALFEMDTNGTEQRADNHTIGSRSRSPQPHAAGGSAQAQAQGTSNSPRIRPQVTNVLDVDSRSRPTILLHGRQVPRLLHHHYRLLARPNRRRLRRLFTGALPTHWREGSAHRGLLFPEKVDHTQMG